MPSRSTLSGLRIAAFLQLTVLFLLTACSPAVKYVFVTDRGDVDFADGDRFSICLARVDADRVPGMLNLRTEAEVRRYAQTRKGKGDPLEHVLFALITSDYPTAEAELDKGGEGIPRYLRLFLAADLAYEIKGPQIPASELIKLYQNAYEDQACDLNKDLIQMRVRQVRYGR